MESYVLPELQKSTSVECNIAEKENEGPWHHSSKYKVGSLPQLPQVGVGRGLALTKKNSCIERYHDHPENAADRAVLYQKVLSLLQDMIANPAKFEHLLSALHSMENSIKNVRKSKGSIDVKISQGRSQKYKLSQRSIGCESPVKMEVSLGLSLEEGRKQWQGKEQICEFMAESIEIECPYDGLLGGIDKVSLVESEELRVSHFSGARSIEEEMLDSLHFPDLPDMYRRISLLLVDEEKEGSDLCSSGGSNSPPRFPALVLALPLVESLFAQASPLLTNLALSLLFKFILRSREKLSGENAGWLLGVSALVAYKIFYDETLQGILEYFGRILGVGSEQAARLERWFLGELNYEVLINNKHYTEIMIKLMGNQ